MINSLSKSGSIDRRRTIGCAVEDPRSPGVIAGMGSDGEEEPSVDDTEFLWRRWRY